MTTRKTSFIGDCPSCRVDDLMRPDVLAAFDRLAFERDGYWVWEGVLTDVGRQQWTERLRRLQQMSDAMVIDTDWAAIDFSGRGIAPIPAEHLTREHLASACNGKELYRLISTELRQYMHDHGLLGPGPALATSGFESEGIMPEYFPAGYDDFILDVTAAHPQMMELLTKLLGDNFVLDHCLLINRAGGNEGCHWHAHQYRQGQYEVEHADASGDNPSTDFLQQQCVRTLVYPEGAEIENGGGEIAVIPGAHLYRVPYKWNTPRTEYDNEIKAGWLKGKRHPVTGKPLRIMRLSLPPGSMVSFVHHMPHQVGPRCQGVDTRWTLLMAYRTPDSQANPTRWTEAVPRHWVERMVAGGKLSSKAQLVFKGDNPAG